MPYKFTPKHEKDLSAGGFELIPPGEYPFTVLESDIVASKSEKNAGKPMIKVNLIIHAETDRRIYDYFADWFSEWKLKHFCEVAGLGKQYMTGQVDPSANAWKDKQGFVKIGIEAAKDGREPQNKVLDYLPEEEQKVEHLEANIPSTQPKAGPDDDVPF